MSLDSERSIICRHICGSWRGHPALEHSLRSRRLCTNGGTVLDEHTLLGLPARSLCSDVDAVRPRRRYCYRASTKEHLRQPDDDDGSCAPLLGLR